MNLRLAYALCAQLKTFVGPVGVYGDVNDILMENMDNMKVSLCICQRVISWQTLLSCAAHGA